MRVDTDPFLSVEILGGYAVATFPTEVDLANAPALREKLLELLNRGVTALIVDMTPTEFCDSSGLGALIRAQKRATAQGVAMRVVAQHPTVRKVFEITALQLAIPIDNTLDEARDAIVGKQRTAWGSRSPGVTQGDTGHRADAGPRIKAE